MKGLPYIVGSSSGLFLSMMALTVAILSFFAAITSQWVVLEVGGNHPNGSSVNTTVEFGMTHICVDSECSKHDYVPPAGCERTAASFDARVGAIEGFLLIGFIVTLATSLLTPVLALTAMQHERLRESLRNDVELVTECRVQRLAANEALVRKGVIADAVLCVFALLSFIMCVGLFSWANSSYLFCTSICSYLLSFYPDGSCGFGPTYDTALASLILCCFLTVFVVLLALLYLQRYDSLMDGIIVPDSSAQRAERYSVPDIDIAAAVPPSRTESDPTPSSTQIHAEEERVRISAMF